MKYIILLFLALTITPAFAQEPKIGDYLDSTNPSLLIQETEIPYHGPVEQPELGLWTISCG